MSAPTWPIDTEPSLRFPVYTRMNANDVLPDPITPLGATLAWIPSILPGWGAGYVANKSFTAAEMSGEAVAPVAGFFYGYLYVNQSTVRVIGIRQGIGTDVVDSAFFGGHPDAPAHIPDASDENESLKAAQEAQTAWALTTTTYPSMDEDKAWADRCRAQRPDLATTGTEALIAHARSLMPIERLVWRGETVGSNSAALGPAVLGQLLGADPSLVLKVIGHAGDVDSAAPTYALWDLSRLVRADAALGAEFDAGIAGLPARVADHPTFGPAFAAFLREFGYRGPGEWDLGSDSWETVPELPLGLVDRLRQLEDSEAPSSRQADQAGETEAATAEALALIGDNPDSVQLFHTAVGSARRFGAWRERGKTNCVKVLHEARMALTEVANRLHAEGHLESPRQLFMALESELDILVSDPASLRSVLAQREKEWQSLFGLDLPTFVEAGKPLTPLSELHHKTETVYAPAVAGDVLQGVGASAGVARGRARIVHDPSSIADFEPGEVLVAPQTDPSWTPLFMVSAAVVVDVGAMASHAMIVSRELGIPCAAGVVGASRRIPDGALVEVDGSTGTVTVLEL